MFDLERGEDLYDLFGRYGAIRQVRLGNENKTKGTAFVVYEDVMDVSPLHSLRHEAVLTSALRFRLRML